MDSTATAHVSDSLTASYFDGVTARAQAATLRLVAGDLTLRGEGFERCVCASDVQWPERTRHGLCVAHFADEGSVQCADASLWDAWRQHSGQRDSLVVRAQQSWRSALVSLLLLALLGTSVYQLGLPWAARALVAVTPKSVDSSLGQTSLLAIDGSLMQPNELPLDEQALQSAASARALAAQPAGTVPVWQLVSRKSRIGTNVFALPSGTMVMTDEMVTLMGASDKVITAVLAHELGHVRYRHDLRVLVQATVIAGVSSVVLGDFSTLLAGVPLLLVQASYSRDAEKEADAEAVRILKAADASPGVMVTLFNKLAAENKPAASNWKDSVDATAPSSWLGIAFASYPSDADRIAYSKQSARDFQEKP